MIERIENTAQDIQATLEELELDIIKDKNLIRENNFDDIAAIQFSANIYNLFVKRVKYSFFIKGEFEKGNKFEKLLIQNKEAISHTISANAMKILMNTMLYDVSPDDTFREILKEYSEYLKPLVLKVF